MKIILIPENCKLRDALELSNSEFEKCNHENTKTHLNYMGTDWVCSCGKEIMGDEE